MVIVGYQLLHYQRVVVIEWLSLVHVGYGTSHLFNAHHVVYTEFTLSIVLINPRATPSGLLVIPSCIMVPTRLGYGAGLLVRLANYK